MHPDLFGTGFGSWVPPCLSPFFSAPDPVRCAENQHVGQILKAECADNQHVDEIIKAGCAENQQVDEILKAGCAENHDVEEVAKPGCAENLNVEDFVKPGCAEIGRRASSVSPDLCAVLLASIDTIKMAAVARMLVAWLHAACLLL